MENKEMIEKKPSEETADAGKASETHREQNNEEQSELLNEKVNELLTIKGSGRFIESASKPEHLETAQKLLNIIGRKKAEQIIKSDDLKNKEKLSEIQTQLGSLTNALVNSMLNFQAVAYEINSPGIKLLELEGALIKCCIDKFEAIPKVVNKISEMTKKNSSEVIRDFLPSLDKSRVDAEGDDNASKRIDKPMNDIGFTWSKNKNQYIYME